MHDHLYYTDSASFQVVNGRIPEPGLFVAEIPYTAPRLYLAAGVTTMRTTGSLEPYTDLMVKNRIDAGLMPGPALDTTAPYLEGAPTHFAQMHELTGPDDATRMVDYWAAEGHDLLQGLHEHLPRRARRRHYGRPRTPPQAHRPSLLRHLA